MPSESELGNGDYTAEQANETVVIHATGETPTAGYRVWLQKSMIDVYPPEYALYWEPPDGLAADMMTPFQVHVSFPAEEAVSTVTVHDADGAHRVRVDQA